MEVRILGICPVVDSYDEKGEYRGDKNLCSGSISRNAGICWPRMNSST